ncbi:hypothetical protein [Devosia sp. 919]|uniref:hypothetical protein n=1 Tax=Devosia sp. 919 TaxID=2726065 RepID=UPI001556078C|nr:hypothetical protein [Devosia sp. 919]
MNIKGPKPAVLPQFTIAVHMYIPIKMAVGKLRVVVLQELGETTREMIALDGDLEPEGVDLQDDDHFFIANFHLNAVPLQIEDDCVLKVRGYVGDEQEEVRMGSFRINFEEPASAA